MRKLKAWLVTRGFPLNGHTVRIRIGLWHCDLTFSHKSCLRGVAWTHPSYEWAKRGDAGTASSTVLPRQKSLPGQSKRKFALLPHHPLIIAQAGKGCLGRGREGCCRLPHPDRFERSEAMDFLDLNAA